MWMTAPLESVSKPFVPDQVAVPLLFSSRKARATLAEDGKLMPPLALVVALAPAGHPFRLTVEHNVPPVQFNAVEKLRIPGAAPPRTPLVKFTVAVVMVCVPVPKSIVAPLKFTVPAPVIGPLCRNKPPAKLTVPPSPAV